MEPQDPPPRPVAPKRKRPATEDAEPGRPRKVSKKTEAPSIATQFEHYATVTSIRHALDATLVVDMPDDVLTQRIREALEAFGAVNPKLIETIATAMTRGFVWNKGWTETNMRAPLPKDAAKKRRAWPIRLQPLPATAKAIEADKPTPLADAGFRELCNEIQMHLTMLTTENPVQNAGNNKPIRFDVYMVLSDALVRIIEYILGTFIDSGIAAMTRTPSSAANPTYKWMELSQISLVFLYIPIGMRRAIAERARAREQDAVERHQAIAAKMGAVLDTNQDVNAIVEYIHTYYAVKAWRDIQTRLQADESQTKRLRTTLANLGDVATDDALLSAAVQIGLIIPNKTEGEESVEAAQDRLIRAMRALVSDTAVAAPMQTATPALISDILGSIMMHLDAKTASRLAQVDTFMYGPRSGNDPRNYLRSLVLRENLLGTTGMTMRIVLQKTLGKDLVARLESAYLVGLQTLASQMDEDVVEVKTVTSLDQFLSLCAHTSAIGTVQPHNPPDADVGQYALAFTDNVTPSAMQARGPVWNNPNWITVGVHEKMGQWSYMGETIYSGIAKSMEPQLLQSRPSMIVDDMIPVNSIHIRTDTPQNMADDIAHVITYGTFASDTNQSREVYGMSRKQEYNALIGEALLSVNYGVLGSKVGVAFRTLLLQFVTSHFFSKKDEPAADSNRLFVTRFRERSFRGSKTPQGTPVRPNQNVTVVVPAVHMHTWGTPRADMDRADPTWDANANERFNDGNLHGFAFGEEMDVTSSGAKFLRTVCLNSHRLGALALLFDIWNVLIGACMRAILRRAARDATPAMVQALHRRHTAIETAIDYLRTLPMLFRDPAEVIAEFGAANQNLTEDQKSELATARKVDDMSTVCILLIEHFFKNHVAGRDRYSGMSDIPESLKEDIRLHTHQALAAFEPLPLSRARSELFDAVETLQRDPTNDVLRATALERLTAVNELLSVVSVPPISAEEVYIQVEAVGKANSNNDDDDVMIIDDPMDVDTM